MAERTIRWALDAALAQTSTTAADAAAVALARRYADDLDEAAVVSVQAARMLEAAEALLPEADYERLRSLAARVEETAVLGLLGPKLVAVLAELGMTPRARADVTRKGGAPGEPPDNPLARYRAERERRLRGGAG